MNKISTGYILNGSVSKLFVRMKKKSVENDLPIISFKKEKISDQQIFEHWKRVVSKIREREVKGGTKGS